MADSLVRRFQRGYGRGLLSWSRFWGLWLIAIVLVAQPLGCAIDASDLERPVATFRVTLDGESLLQSKEHGDRASISFMWVGASALRATVVPPAAVSPLREVAGGFLSVVELLAPPPDSVLVAKEDARLRAGDEWPDRTRVAVGFPIAFLAASGASQNGSSGLTLGPVGGAPSHPVIARPAGFVVLYVDGVAPRLAGVTPALKPGFNIIRFEDEVECMYTTPILGESWLESIQLGHCERPEIMVVDDPSSTLTLTTENHPYFQSLSCESPWLDLQDSTSYPQPTAATPVHCIDDGDRFLWQATPCRRERGTWSPAVVSSDGNPSIWPCFRPPTTQAQPAQLAAPNVLPLATSPDLMALSAARDSLIVGDIAAQRIGEVNLAGLGRSPGETNADDHWHPAVGLHRLAAAADSASIVWAGSSEVHVQKKRGAAFTTYEVAGDGAVRHFYRVDGRWVWVTNRLVRSSGGASRVIGESPGGVVSFEGTLAYVERSGGESWIKVWTPDGGGEDAVSPVSADHRLVGMDSLWIYTTRLTSGLRQLDVLRRHPRLANPEFSNDTEQLVVCSEGPIVTAQAYRGGIAWVNEAGEVQWATGGASASVTGCAAWRPALPTHHALHRASHPAAALTVGPNDGLWIAHPQWSLIVRREAPFEDAAP